MTLHLGDFPTSHTAVCIPFDSFAASTGASSAVTNFASSDILIYKDGGTTQRSSANGITVTTSFDTQTGLQMIVIDLSDNTDAGFYAAGHEYQVGVADITVDSQTVRFWAATFSIERAGGALALLKHATYGLSAIETIDAAVKAKTDSLTFTVAGVIDANALRVGGTAQTGRDLGASVLISSGSGAGQLDVTSGVIKASLVQILGTALTETAGQIAAAFKQFFDVASPTGTMKAITNVVTATNLTTNNDKTGYGLSSSERNSVADAMLDRDMSTGTDSGSTTVRTMRQALRFLRNKWSISGTTLSVFKEDDATTSWTTEVGTTVGADPISSSDPAGP